MKNKQKEKNESDSFVEDNRETGIVKNPVEDIFYEIIDNNILLSLPVTEFLIKKKDQDAQMVFNYYCYCSKLQRNTKRVWASNEFVRKNLGWRKQRLLQVKKRLIEYGLIRVVPYREKNDKTNFGSSIKKWFVEIVPLLNAQNISSTGSQNTTPSIGSLSVEVPRGNQSSIEINNNKFYKKKNTSISDPDISDHNIEKSKLEEDIQKIFQIYISKILPGSRLTTKSKAKIKSRLEEFSLEDILKGIDNFSKDNWWMEHNAFRGISWFFYSEDRTELFKNLVPRKKPGEEKEQRIRKFQ